MNFNLFIARKLFREHGDVKKVSRPAILIATSGVAGGGGGFGRDDYFGVRGAGLQTGNQFESRRIRFSYTDSKLCVGHDKFPAAYCGAPCFDEGGRGHERGGACATFLQ